MVVPTLCILQTDHSVCAENSGCPHHAHGHLPFRMNSEYEETLRVTGGDSADHANGMSTVSQGSSADTSLCGGDVSVCPYSLTLLG